MRLTVYIEVTKSPFQSQQGCNMSHFSKDVYFTDSSGILRKAENVDCEKLSLAIKRSEMKCESCLESNRKRQGDKVWGGRDGGDIFGSEKYVVILCEDCFTNEIGRNR